MPSFQDSIVIFVLALMLLGPKRLPQLARQLGKLMAEFRRASNEFRMQMEDELRIEEQKEHEAKVAAMDGPPSSTAEPYNAEAAIEASEGVTALPAPIAESGSLKMMPPSTGLPVEAGTNGAAANHPADHDGFGPLPGAACPDSIPEHTIHTAGVSSDEPRADAATHEQAHA